MQDLGTLGGQRSWACDVSADGSVVVGSSYLTGNSRTHAFRWTGIIRNIDTLDAENELSHRTNDYVLSSALGNDQSRTILRRGERRGSKVGTADFDIAVCGDFDAEETKLCFEYEHTFNGPPTIKEVPLYTGTVPSGQWGCVLENLGPSKDGERIAHMRVHIPADAPVGEYAFRAVAKDAAGTRLEEREFEYPVVVLFNPMDPDDTVSKTSSKERDEYVLNPTGIMWRGTGKSQDTKAWSYGQFKESVFLTSLDLLNGLNSTDRIEPNKVVAQLASKMRSDTGGVLAEGKWCSGCDPAWTSLECLAFQISCYAGGTLPQAWKSSEQIFNRFRANNGAAVKYAQCWVFAGTLTSSLRSLGIPARPVTNYESADDHTPADGVATRCWRQDPVSGTWVPEGDSVWNFHVWCEAWTDNEWSVADGTYGNLDWPVPVADVKAKSAANFTTEFVIAEVDANYREGYFSTATGSCVYPDPANDPYFLTRVGRHITTKAVGNTSGEPLTAKYKTPETTADPREWSDVSITTDPDVALGDAIGGVVEIKNTSAQAGDFTCYVHVLSVGQDGGRMGSLYGPVTDALTIAANDTGAVTFSAPWEQIRPWLAFSDTAIVDVVVTRLSDNEVWFRQALVRVRGLPVNIVMEPVDMIQPGGQAVATIHYSNPLTTPLENAQLELVSDAGLPIDGAASGEVISLGQLAPGASGTVVRTLVGLSEGPRGLIAILTGDEATTGTDLAPMTVGYCPSDFDRTGFVDTDDFTAFVLSFEAGTDDADVDGSGFVDTDDFTYFVLAFEAGC